MAELHDHVASFADETGTSILPEGFAQGFESAYLAERSVYESAVAEANTERDTMAAELQKLQATLFKLTTQDSPAEPPTSNDGDPDSGVDDEDDVPSIEDLAFEDTDDNDDNDDND